MEQTKNNVRTAQQLLELSADAVVDQGVILADILDEEKRQTKYLADIASAARLYHSLTVIGIVVGFIALAIWIVFNLLP